ncbi:MAG: hypothetical protein AAB426_15345, partial [Myxococcota bacterium]
KIFKSVTTPAEKALLASALLDPLPERQGLSTFEILRSEMKEGFQGVDQFVRSNIEHRDDNLQERFARIKTIASLAPKHAFHGTEMTNLVRTAPATDTQELVASLHADGLLGAVMSVANRDEVTRGLLIREIEKLAPADHVRALGQVGGYDAATLTKGLDRLPAKGFAELAAANNGEVLTALVAAAARNAHDPVRQDLLGRIQKHVAKPLDQLTAMVAVGGYSDTTTGPLLGKLDRSEVGEVVRRGMVTSLPAHAGRGAGAIGGQLDEVLMILDSPQLMADGFAARGIGNTDRVATLMQAIRRAKGDGFADDVAGRWLASGVLNPFIGFVDYQPPRGAGNLDELGRLLNRGGFDAVVRSDRQALQAFLSLLPPGETRGQLEARFEKAHDINRVREAFDEAYEELRQAKLSHLRTEALYVIGSGYGYDGDLYGALQREYLYNPRRGVRVEDLHRHLGRAQHSDGEWTVHERAAVAQAATLGWFQQMEAIDLAREALSWRAIQPEPPPQDEPPAKDGDTRNPYPDRGSGGGKDGGTKNPYPSKPSPPRKDGGTKNPF